jgi:predicted dehydrogenase
MLGMNRGNLSRRGFLQRSFAALTLGAGLPAWFAREVLVAEAAAAPAREGANDKIQLGVIGSGDRFKGGLLHDVKRQKDLRVIATCDVDRNHRDEVAHLAEQTWKGKCDRYNDFRDLCARKDIDAVVIATPDHWHAIPAIAAMKAGKDVYGEKPLSLTIAEGRAMVKTARAGKRVYQVGSQQRSDARFRLACELVRNGRIGKVKTIETRIGDNPQGGPFPEEPVPDGLDWDFWLGQTAKVPFVKERCHYQFRWWYEYSGGKMTDWGAHHNDIAQWALGMDDSGPVAVEAEGTPPSTQPNSYNCHAHFKVTYTYANGTVLHCLSDGENGIRFEGEDGKWIFVSRSRIDASDKKLIDEPLPRGAVRLYVSHDHMGNWRDCLRSRKRPITDVAIGHRSVSVCHIGVIALRTGKKLKWDPAKEEFIGDDEANGWLSRKMREPWKLEV